MTLQKIIEENEKEFEKEFQHSKFCRENKVGAPCNCDYDDFKSFLLSSQTTFIKGLIEEVEGMKSKDGGGEDYDEVENKDYNQALQKVIDYLKG